MASRKSDGRRPNRGRKSVPARQRPRLSKKPDAALPVRASLHVWQKLADRLEADIVADLYLEAGRLPAETALARQYGVKRHTLRRAISALVGKGLLRSVPHQGAFLRPKRLTLPVAARSSLAEALNAQGMTPGARVLSQRTCKPPDKVAGLLGIARRTDVLELVYLKTANDRPICYVTTWLPAERLARAGDLYAAFGEMRHALARLGIAHYRRTWVQISSRTGDEQECAALDLGQGSQLIVMESKSADAAGEPTHVSTYRFPADRVELIVKL